MNPFKQKAKPIESCLVDWKTLASVPYNKNTVDPYTKLRIILMNGTEFESVWLGHQFSRHCGDNELRRELALMRRVEQQQQKRIAALKPPDETVLETTIGYEMLAVDLTSALARREKSPAVKKALDFALLEDFDHLYRYSDLLEGERGIPAEKLVGRHIEIMPGRPTIAHHRHPFDDIKPEIEPNASLATKLHVNIITAAEQQTMNYYMNIGAFHDTEAGRRLYAEIGMVEEQHVSQYGSLKPTGMSWLEGLLMHEYTECYLYHSCYQTEKNEHIRQLWEEFFEQELAHLHKAAELLQKYEGKEASQLIPDGTFPAVLELCPSIDYLRKVLADSVRITADRDDYAPLAALPDDADFFRYQQTVNRSVREVPSHRGIEDYIAKKGKDYRYETQPNPIPALRSRTEDQVETGRCKAEAEPS